MDSSRRDPAAMQRRKQRQRIIDGQRTIGESGPGSLVIRLDGGPILSEGELVADVAVGVAVGQVMHHLAHRPSAFAIGRIELRIAQSRHGLAQAIGQRAQSLNVRRANSGHAAGQWAVAADGKPQVFQLGLSHGLDSRTLALRFAEIICGEGLQRRYAGISFWDQSCRAFGSLLGHLVGSESRHETAWSRQSCSSGTRSVLGVMVMMMVAMMMVSRGEHRGCKHHQQQNGDNCLLHAKNLARRLPGRKSTDWNAPSKGLGSASARRNRFQRKLKRQ